MIRIGKQITLYLATVLVGSTAWGSSRSLQEILDSGDPVQLKPGQVVEISRTLVIRTPGQRIETVGATGVSDYATIRLADGAQGALVKAHGIPGATLSKLILDGNRPGFKSVDGTPVAEPMLSLGGEGAVSQRVEKCIVLDGRCAGGWGAIHVREGGADIVVRDNVVFSAGVDIRGNGRSPLEKAFGWGDGISTASRNSQIVNNLIIDATDEGIMLQGAPGSVVQSNVVVAISREMFGGIALIDPFKFYELDAGKRSYDYRDVVVEENQLLAVGGRIHVGFPMGGSPWTPGFAGTTLVGSTVRNNHMGGAAAGYGFIMDGVGRFEVFGNTSDAICSGLGDGLPGRPPDDPAPFLFNPGTCGRSRLQDAFVPMKRHLTGVLRARRGLNDSRNLLDYRNQPYPDEEATAVVRMAFIEMVGRVPTDAEAGHWKQWLQATRSNADRLRQNLMANPEFVEKQGYVDPLELHRWRSRRWLDQMKVISAQRGDEWPGAAVGFRKLMESLQR